MFRAIALTLLLFAGSVSAWATDKTEAFDDTTTCDVLASVVHAQVAVDVILAAGYIATVWQYAEDDVAGRGGKHVADINIQRGAKLGPE